MKVLFKLTLSWGAHASLEDSQSQTDEHCRNNLTLVTKASLTRN